MVEPGLGRHLGGCCWGFWMGERGGWTGLASLDQGKENGMILSVDAGCFAHYVRLGDW